MSFSGVFRFATMMMAHLVGDRHPRHVLLTQHLRFRAQVLFSGVYPVFNPDATYSVSISRACSTGALLDKSGAGGYKAWLQGLCAITVRRMRCC